MQLETQEFRAEAKFQRVSPQKARLVLELIKGRRVADALDTVAFTKKGVAPLVEKVLRAAIQNANYLSQERDRMKRIRPAPMGRAFRYQRRMSHIVISVAERKRAALAETVDGETAAPKKRAVKKSAAKKTVAKKSAAKNWNKKAAK